MHRHQHRCGGSVHCDRPARQDVQGGVPAQGASAQEPVTGHRGLGHADLTAGSLEYLWRVHGRYSRRRNAGLPAIRFLQPDGLLPFRD